MPSIILRTQSIPQELSNTSQTDRISPLTYREWLSNNIGVIPNQAEQQYSNYLASFYVKKEQNLQIDQSAIKNDYIALLQRLQVIFKDDLEFNRIANIDFSNETELKLSIPYFARKLKEIALFYISKRETIKKTKLKYNLVGSNDAVEKILYEYLLQAFTKKNNNVTVQSKHLFNNIPSLSSITENFDIVVEELSDMENYFDPTYANTNNNLGVYPISGINPLLFVLEDYIYNLYEVLNIEEVPLSAISNPLSQFILCESGDELNDQIASSINSKYIGNDLYYLTGGYFDYNKVDVSLDMLQGNNFFYWFSGEYIREIPEGIYQNISLSSIDWENATGAVSVSSSDIIFKSVGNNVVEGAWLADTRTITVNDTMSATIRNGTTFKFPYPGIGVSASNIGWSGPTVEDISEYSREFFPNEKSFIENIENIKNTYWNNYSSISSVSPLYLNDSHLSESGAFASNSFNNADKLVVRRNVGDDNLHDTAPSQIFNGTMDAAWLYNFAHTELPIIPGVNNLYYPLTSYNDVTQLNLKYTSGEPISLSSINVGSSFAGAIAGSNISTADLLVKLDSACGTPREGAWLKGYPLSAFSDNIIDTCNCDGNFISYYTDWKFKNGVTQSSLFFKGVPGQFVRFVWTGPTTNLNDIKGFDGFDHDASCPYYQNRNYTSLINNNFLDLSKLELFEKWKTCTCKAIHYSPLGHNKDAIDYYGVTPDFIARDTKFPNAFSFINWKGSDGNDYKSSSDLAWFKVNSLLEPDLGWGNGVWQNNIGEDFYLRTGETYIFYRSNLNRCNFELPFFIINEGYCECSVNVCNTDNCIPVWTKAILNDSGVWEDGGTISDMTLLPDTFIKYTHRNEFAFSKSILSYEGNIINSVSGDYVTLSAVDLKIGEIVSPQSIPSVNFLVKIPLSGNTPYWGEASYENNSLTNNKLKMVGARDFRNDFGYLQIKQPMISNIILNNNDVIEYQTSQCNDCFIWTEPLHFSIQSKYRGWNKILTDSCVKSELLNYLQDTQCSPCNIQTNKCLSECQSSSICGCDNLCFPSKTGITATNIPSDMIFNTELSGIPVFVDYYARSPFNVKFSMIETSNGVPPNGGVWVPPVSTLFANAEFPWRNIINDMYPIVAAVQTSTLSTVYDLGLFTPDRRFNGKYELRKAIFDIDYLERSVGSDDIVRDATYTDGPINTKTVDSSWMKSPGNNIFSGNVKINGNQTYYPYVTNFDIYKNNNIGLYDLNDSLFSPWRNGEWADELKYPSNFRNQHPVNCGPNAWFTNQLTLTGHVINWSNDIFGNQYFVLNDNSNNMLRTTTYSKLYTKDGNGSILDSMTSLKNVFDKYKNIAI